MRTTHARLPITLLFTRVGMKSPLLLAFRAAFAELAVPGRIVAVDASPYAIARRFSDVFYRVPPRDDARYIPTLLDIAASERVSLVIPTADGDLLCVAEHRSAFEDCGARVLIAPTTTVAIAGDKARFFAHCAVHNIPALSVLDPRDVRAGRVPLPVFVNSCSGTGARSAGVARTLEEYDVRLRSVRDPLTTAYIAAPEYSVDCFADFDGTILSVVPRRRVLVVDGESWISVTERQPTLIVLAQRLLATLPIVGPANIQCFFDGTRATCIEMNARFGGAMRLAFVAGAASPQLLLRLLCGERVAPRIGEFRDRLCMVRYKDDVFVDAQEFGDV